jgi:AcrR family transcriptional regulator
MAANPKNPKARAKPAKPRRYHHGNLKEALIDATLRMVEESGVEKVSVREAAKRAGVSPGAPFRHFPNRTALMTAVAEQATRRLRNEINRALAHCDSDDPLKRLEALGAAYMRWAVQNPTHFRIVSDRSLIDYDGSEALRRDNEEIRSRMDELLIEAWRRGLLFAQDLQHIPLAARAIAYGMARMFVDGHFPQWGVVAGQTESAFGAVFKLFIEGIAARGRSGQAGSLNRRRALPTT